MFSNSFLLKDEREIEVEIERKCLALGLDCTDGYAVSRLARELINHIDTLRKAANDGDMHARIKVELYGLAMLMHMTNTETFGPGYMSQIKSLSKSESAWSAIAQAIWNELDRSAPTGGSQDTKE
ncbi:MAG: hypothetical protein WA632_09445 [Gallionella sp.]